MENFCEDITCYIHINLRKTSAVAIATGLSMYVHTYLIDIGGLSAKLWNLQIELLLH